MLFIEFWNILLQEIENKKKTSADAYLQVAQKVSRKIMFTEVI